ncbi:MAG TPA: hypothetical protein ENI89_03045 [Desulfobulbus sp.]|nr:hypothetical protein [Desulfobulbus sp.]
MLIQTSVVRAAGVLLALGGLALAAGCAGPKTYGAVKFISRPPGAEVINLKDDTHLGMTPLLVVWEGEEGRPEYVTVEMLKSGYREEITAFWVNTRHRSRKEAEAEPQPVTVELKKRK